MQNQTGIHWPSLGQFAYSGLALLGLFGLVLGLGVAAISGQMRGTAADLSMVLRMAALILAIILILPSLVLSLLRLLGLLPEPQVETVLLPGVHGWIALGVIALVWVLSWLLSSRLYTQAQPSPLLITPLFLLVAGLPVAFWFVLGAFGLPGGSPQRRWGLLAASMTGSTTVIMILEIVALIGVVILASVAIASRPDWVAEMNQLAQRITTSPLDPETLTRLLTPYLTQPWVIFLGLAVTSGLVPLIEELLKPLAVWVLAGRRITPAEGFVAGLTCGAGFALFESMGMLSSISGSAWQAMAAGRAGTDLLHITTSGLMGWALAASWQDGKYVRLLLAYLGSVTIHGLWNMASLGSSILPALQPLQSPVLRWMQNPMVANAGLWVVGVILLAILFGLSSRLRARQATSLVESNQTSRGFNS